MIAWLLKELEKNPTSLFRKKDLLKKSKAQFEKLRHQGFLGYSQPSSDHETYPCTLSCPDTCPMEVVEMEDRLFAICPEDTEVDPIPLTKDDISRYRFSLDTLIREIRKANGFTGDTYVLSQHLHFIGERVIQDTNTAFILAMFPNIGSAEPHLLSLPARIPSACPQMVVVTPSLRLTQEPIYAKLRAASIIPIALPASFGQRDFKISYLAALRKRLPSSVGSQEPNLTSEQLADYEIRANAWEELLQQQTEHSSSSPGHVGVERDKTQEAGPPRGGCDSNRVCDDRPEFNRDSPTTGDMPEIPPEERRNSELILLFLLAQAYYKMLECTVSMADWCSAMDLELNGLYLWTVRNITNLLKGSEDLKDFPVPFEPLFPDLYPATIRDCDWEDGVAPEAEQFLSTVQQYVQSKGIYDPQEGSVGWIFLELYRPSVNAVIEKAIAYNKRMRQHMRQTLGSASPKAETVTTQQEVEGAAPANRKKRPTKAEMANRNKAVAMAAAQFKVGHNRLPTVDEIVDETKYSRNEIYATNAYKDRKIARSSAKATTEMTGSSVQKTEYYSQKSEEHSRTDRRSKSEQAELDATIDEQEEDDRSNFVK